MLSFLTNWKTYLLLAALSISGAVNLLQQRQLKKVEAKYQACQNTIATQQAAVDAVKVLQEKMLVLREQEAAERAQQSLKRKDEIMAMEVGDKCEDAIRFGIEQAH